jgi:hypothetical protein
MMLPNNCPLTVSSNGYGESGVMLIKLANKISNVREIGEKPPSHWGVQRQREYFEWARQVVAAMPERTHRSSICFLKPDPNRNR